MNKLSNHALAELAAFLLGPFNIHLHAATFSDDNWTSMGGYPGVNDPVFATAVDGSGNLYIAGWFTIAGGVFATNIAKWDGANWSALGSGLQGNNAFWHYALAVSGNDLYVAGNFTTAGGIAANNIAKWNGTNWSALGSGIAGGLCCGAKVGGAYAAYVYSLAVSGSDLYVGGRFTNAGGVMTFGLAKWDGSSWSALGSGLQGFDYLGNPYISVSALTVSGNDLYVAGGFSTAGGIAATNMAKWNGNSWSDFPRPIYGASQRALGGGVNNLTILGNNLYAAGVVEISVGVGASIYAGYVVKWNGSNWSPLEPGMSGNWHYTWDPEVMALAVPGTNVYAGGAFTSAGNKTAHCIAKWNGSNWSAVRSGHSSVSAMAASSKEVYAAVSSTGVDGVVSNYVGRWNGSGWSPLGSGKIHDVSALAVSGPDLYAAGNFTNVGITANVAKCNGTGWSALGSGLGRTDADTVSVYALAVSGIDLYAGGYFTTAGGIAATNIAKWNGTNWSTLGWAAGGYRPVYALAVSGSNLYAGGTFSAADGSPGNYIAKWDGSSWSALGSGMGGSVRALAVAGNDLYAGGDFTIVAKWNGSSWSGLSSGMTRDDWGSDGENFRTPTVYALAATRNALDVGGYFTAAGDIAATYIASWNGDSWSPLGSGMSRNSGVGELAASDTDLFAAGSFTTAGGKLSPYLARARIGSVARSVAVINSTASIQFSGVTGYPYDVQRATNLTPPIPWTTVTTNPLSPAPDGSFIFTDTNAPPRKSYYRAVER